VAVGHPCIASGTCRPPAPGANRPPAEPAVETPSPAPMVEPTSQSRGAPAGLSVVGAYPDDTAWSCLATNPSCARDPWWAEWNELQDDTRVTYSAIGSHFSTERRFAEAVDLLWQSPEGKLLLPQAERSGVLVFAL